MNSKYLRQSPCSIVHYTLDDSTGVIFLCESKGLPNPQPCVHLSMWTIYKICLSTLQKSFDSSLIKKDFSHDKMIELSAPLENGLTYHIKIRLL